MLAIKRRMQEFSLIGRDPVLALSLIISALFLFAFIVFPIAQTVWSGFFNKEGQFSLTYFARYFDSYYGPVSRQIFLDTLTMGVLTASGGTILGFIFAYTIVRCRVPGKNFLHVLALVPTVSPPFAIALSTILLFGRNGLVTKGILNMRFPPGSNDVYGMDGLVFVQIITFFSVAYLILRAMLERLDPSMEEAARSMGAGKAHIFRTVTLPLLIPGIAGSFLLLFVEALADLGNPLFIAGNVTVLSAQIFLAIAGEYDYQKASALAFVLLIPTLVVFLVQRYYVSRRSYISVTGKPTGGLIEEKEGWIRWPFIIVTYLVSGLIVILYVAIIYGSFSKAWGIDYSFSLEWWKQMFQRGIESILDTTFLSILATPIAVLLGMIVAFLVVRKQFSGKQALDFTSNLGGAVPGTILGIGFVLAFSTPPWFLVVFMYVVLFLFTLGILKTSIVEKVTTGIVGTLLGIGFFLGGSQIGLVLLTYFIAILSLGFGIYLILTRPKKKNGIKLISFGIYAAFHTLIEYVAQPLMRAANTIPEGTWKNAATQFPDYVQVFFKLPHTILGCVLMILIVTIALQEKPAFRRILVPLFMGGSFALIFGGKPLALVGTPYIILAAFAVRSLPASVRSGVASLQQIDPSIEEASSIMGADAQYTFRKVTLPLIMPAILAGLIFSFTRHMTSLSAIIFLVSAKWRIVTASILSEWEQGGISMAAAYSTIIIVFVLIAIGILYLVSGKMLRRRGGIDITWGA
ncbi:MAG: ABC transporter permease subunit [Spirochaetes bacterium]|nr:ABC transporter permease subunit [Spirochaetota bacterium]